MEIKNESRKRDAIQPIIGFSCALFMCVLLGVLDVRKLGVEISEGTETTFYWIVRVILILLIPLFVFLIVNFIKQLFKNEVYFRVSKEGIYAKITNKHIYNINYKDIERISYKQYPQGPYIIFIFLKDPSKYLSKEQIEKIKTARVTMSEAGDIGIPSNIIKQNRDKVIELIEYYLKLEDNELS